MTRHPAHQIAETVMYAAAELRGYMDPENPSPWELTDDDHRVLLARFRSTITDLAVCVDGIAAATADEHARAELTKAASNLLPGCDAIMSADQAMQPPDPDLDAMARPAMQAAVSFPQPMTAGALQRAVMTPAPPGSTVGAPRPGQASPGQPR